MPTLEIDGQEITVEPGTSVLQACEQLGIEIPRFCYHDKLSVPANCRMCLVDLEGAPKPIASCAMAAGDNMKISTTSERTVKARKGVMEMLLINHPLDCPICDQGGECDLQDQAMAYGFDRGRFEEAKRAVEDKDLGPLIKTYMTRCIHCTRCVRFADEIAGVSEMGMTGRGNESEIGTYVGNAVTSELSGNMIDICPVGALTSKPYQFNARPWELRKTEGVDVSDAVGSNIRIDARGGEVMRILPRLNEDVNEEWISDKTRFCYDGLKRQRLDRPYVREDGKLRPASWAEAFDAIAGQLTGKSGAKIAAIAGDQADMESIFALKRLMRSLGSPNMDCRQDGAQFDTQASAGYLFNTTIPGIEDADAVLMIGTNPRREAAMVNARLRKRWLNGGKFPAAMIGQPADLGWPVKHLGAGPETMQALLDGQVDFAETLEKAERPMLILGAGALARPDGAAIQGLARRIAEKFGMVREGHDGAPGWNGFNVLQLAAARAGALELGFVPGENGRDMNAILDGAQKGEIEAVWLLGADEFDMARLGRAFVIYQGHHGDAGAHRANVILPGAAFSEKSATWINTEGRVQASRHAVFPPGEAKEDWRILRAFSERIGKTQNWNTLGELRAAMRKACPQIGPSGSLMQREWSSFGSDDAPAPDAFGKAVANFYMTDPVTRASKTMAECTTRFAGSPVTPRPAMSETEGTGTNG